MLNDPQQIARKRFMSFFSSIRHVKNILKVDIIWTTRKGSWGRPKRRFMDVVKEDMAEVEVTGRMQTIGATGD